MQAPSAAYGWCDFFAGERDERTRHSFIVFTDLNENEKKSDRKASFGEYSMRVQKDRMAIPAIECSCESGIQLLQTLHGGVSSFETLVRDSRKF